MTFNYSLVALFLFIGVMSCNNDTPIPPDAENIIGQWISTDKSDTLEFDIANKSMYHSCAAVHNEPYTYQLYADSLTLTYKGTGKANTCPTTHLYYMNGEYLSIDFQKTTCYGFSKCVINYFRLNNKKLP
jgi:hypothetical protein